MPLQSGCAWVYTHNLFIIGPERHQTFKIGARNRIVEGILYIFSASH
jgi:hypothetical protein